MKVLQERLERKEHVQSTLSFSITILAPAVLHISGGFYITE